MPGTPSSTASIASRTGCCVPCALSAGRPGQAWAGPGGQRAHLVGGHLCPPALPGQGHDEDGVSGELRREGHALPILSCVGRVQQDGGLAADPAFLPVKRDGVEAVVEACASSREIWSL